MNIDLGYDEVDEVLASLRMSASEANRTSSTATREGYPECIKDQLSSRAMDLYLLADKIEEQRNRFKAKVPGSSGSIDPFDNPAMEEKTQPLMGACSKHEIRGKDEAKTPNDPIEW